MLPAVSNIGWVKDGLCRGPHRRSRRRQKAQQEQYDNDGGGRFDRPRHADAVITSDRSSDDLDGTVPARIQVMPGPTAAKSEQVRRQQHEQNEDFEIHYWLFPCACGLASNSRPDIGAASAPCFGTIPSATRLASPMRSTNSAAIAFFFGRLRAAFRMEYIVTGLSHGEKKRPALRGNAGRAEPPGPSSCRSAEQTVALRVVHVDGKAAMKGGYLIATEDPAQQRTALDVRCVCARLYRACWSNAALSSAQVAERIGVHHGFSPKRFSRWR